MRLTVPQVKRLGRDLMRPTRELLAAWARYRDGTLTRVGIKRPMTPLRAEIEALLLRGAFSGNGRLEEAVVRHAKREWQPLHGDLA